MQPRGEQIRPKRRGCPRIANTEGMTTLLKQMRFDGTLRRSHGFHEVQAILHWNGGVIYCMCGEHRRGGGIDV